MQGQKRFGVLNSGGTAAGMNDTLEKLCRYSFKEGAKILGFKYGWLGLIKNDTISLDLKNTLGIGLHPGGDFLGSCNKVNVFSHNNKDYSSICHENYISNMLDAIFVIGGDGSSRQAFELSEKFPDMRFIWISGTLDRDVLGCDDTIGFHTAYEVAAEVIADMTRDGATMRRHTITECMGRNSGLVAAYACDYAIRKYHTPIHMLLVPEINFNIEGIRNRISLSEKPLNIVIAEGINLDQNPDVPEEIAGHHKDLANTCRKLKSALQDYSNMEIKTSIVGYAQRTGKISSADCFLADNCARIGVSKAMFEDGSCAIVFNNGSFKSITLEELINLNKDSHEIKSKILLEDPVIELIRDLLAAGAIKKI